MTDETADRGRELWGQVWALYDADREQLDAWEAALSAEDKAALDAHWERFVDGMQALASSMRALPGQDRR